MRTFKALKTIKASSQLMFTSDTKFAVTGHVCKI